MAGELPLQTQEALVVPGLDEFVNDGGGGGEAGFDAMLAGRQADTDGDMGLADAARAKGDDVLAAINELRAGQIQDQFLVERGDRIEVEALQAFNGGNRATLMRRSTMRASRWISSSSISRAR